MMLNLNLMLTRSECAQLNRFLFVIASSTPMHSPLSSFFSSFSKLPFDYFLWSSLIWHSTHGNLSHSMLSIMAIWISILIYLRFWLSNLVRWQHILDQFISTAFSLFWSFWFKILPMRNRGWGANTLWYGFLNPDHSIFSY